MTTETSEYMFRPLAVTAETSARVHVSSSSGDSGNVRVHVRAFRPVVVTAGTSECMSEFSYCSGDS